MTEVNLTEEKLENIREKITDLFKGGKQSWCVACGASAKALKELLGRDPDKFREVISEETITTALTSINIEALNKNNEWCVACGAGAHSSLAEMVSNPAQINSVMSEISKILKTK